MDAINRDATRELGAIMNIGKLNMIGVSSLKLLPPHYINLLFQHALLGDPYIRINIEEFLDLYMLKDELRHETENGSSNIRATDGIVYSIGVVRNSGPAKSKLIQNTDVRFIHEYNGVADTSIQVITSLCNATELTFPFDVTNKIGEHYLTYEIDPEGNNTEETERNNNIIRDTVFVYPAGVLPLDPMPYWNVATSSPQFRVVNPLDYSQFTYEFAVGNTNSSENFAFTSQSNNINVSEAFTEWRPDMDLQNGQAYWLFVRTIDANQNIGDWTVIPFTADASMNAKQASHTVTHEMHFQNEAQHTFVAKGEGQDAQLTMEDRDVSIEVWSDTREGKDAVGNYQRVYLKIGEREFINSSNLLGVVLWVLPKDDSIPSPKRNFKTWSFSGNDDNGKARELVGFMRDSIADDETLILIVHRFTITPLNEPTDYDGKIYMDSVLTALKEFGAELTHTIDEDSEHDSPYILIAQRGNKIAEASQPPPSVVFDRLKVFDTLQVFTGKAIATTASIGAAQAWNSFSITTENTDYGSWKLYALATTPHGLIDTVAQTEGTLLDLSTINATEYPELSFVVEAERSSDVVPAITSMKATFVPVPEVALLPSTVKFAENTLVRGDEARLLASVQSIQPRADVNSARVSAGITPLQGLPGDVYQESIRVDELVLDAIRTAEFDAPTEFLAEQSAAFVSVTYPREQYTFNNSARANDLTLEEDAAPPTIALLMDGKEVQTGDPVARTPVAEAILLDNSPLAMTDSTKIRIRVNGRSFPDPIISTYSVAFVNQGKEKLRAIFTPQFEYRENLVQITAEDNNGSTTSANIRLVVSRFLEFDSASLYPNPIQESATITFSVANADNGLSSSIAIFDAQGRKVHTHTMETTIGENTYIWDGLSDTDVALPSGVYFVRITTSTSFGAEVVEVVPCLLTR
jgi:hypothetical protein